jgi:hypothetical protein
VFLPHAAIAAFFSVVAGQGNIAITLPTELFMEGGVTIVVESGCNCMGNFARDSAIVEAPC